MCRITTLLILLCASFSVRASGGNDFNSPRDTASAVVVYNADTQFLPSISYTTDDYSVMIDTLLSLDTVPIALVNQLNVYRMLSRQNKQQLTAVIDSIFEADNIPQTVVNAVNLYATALHESLQKPTGFAAYVPYGSSPYPADCFYEEWNTLIPNPSRNNLAQFDTTLNLLLVDTAQNCDFHPPFEGVVTSHFGWRFGRNHNGIDIDLEVWDPVHSAFPGVVRVARYYKGYGRVVVVRHYNGLETLYAHLHRFKVKPGDVVEAGDVVGLGGSSGNSTGSHLHFEVRFQGVPIKPSQIIDFSTHTLRYKEIALRKSGTFLAASSTEIPEQKEYLVQKGDYLYKIAEKFGVSVDDLCNLNGINPHNHLKAGQRLIVGI